MEKREASKAGVFAGARHRFDQLLVKLPKARGITRARVTAYSFRTDVTAATSEEGEKQGLSAASSAEESGELNDGNEEEAVGDDSKGIG